MKRATNLISDQTQVWYQKLVWHENYVHLVNSLPVSGGNSKQKLRKLQERGYAALDQIHVFNCTHCQELEEKTTCSKTKE